MPSSGLLLLQRFADLTATNETGGPLASSYRGFDGYWWPQEGPPNDFDFASPSEYSRLLDEMKHPRTGLDLLYVGSSKLPKELFPEFLFLGFDLGYIGSRFDYFSVLLQKVVCGTKTQLQGYTAELNDDLLLDAEAASHAILNRRSELESGEDLETLPFEAAVIPIWGVRR